MQTLEEIKRTAIISIVESYGPKRACEILQIGHTTIYRLMKKYNIDPRAFLKNVEVKKPTKIEFLIIPSTKEEKSRANLKCPTCGVEVLLRWEER